MDATKHVDEERAVGLDVGLYVPAVSKKAMAWDSIESWRRMNIAMHGLSFRREMHAPPSPHNSPVP